MAEREPILLVRDILEYCDRIITSLQSLSQEQFESNRDILDATMRRFEIIGEAVKQLPGEIKSRFPDIEWKKAAGFRDVLIHDYPEIVFEEVYRTGTQQLPAFRAQIEKVLEELEAK